MTKTKPKKSLRPPRTRNPKMIQELQIQNPNNESIIEVAEKKKKEETVQQSDEITCTKNPTLIVCEEPLLPETITEEDPKSIEKEDEATTTTTTDSVSVHEEEKEENADVERISLEEIQEEELGKQHIEMAMGQEKNNVEQQQQQQQQQVRDDDEDVMDFQEPGDSSQCFLEEEDIQHDIVADYCMEQITSWAAKARVSQAQKEEAYMNAQMNQQYLMSEVQHRNDLIATLQTKCEGIPRREIEMFKLERELRMMSNLLVGYRTALKQTQREFSDYRERCPEPEEEPLYKDVPGGGGLVLSTKELEKLRLKCEEEEKMQRRFFEQLIKKFEGSCMAMLEVSEERVHLLDKKLLELEEIFKVRPESEEPLFKDVPWGGGLVPSTVELEKMRLELEEEEKMQRNFFEELIKKFEGSCIATLEVSKEKVHLLDKRLLELEEDFKVVKEIFNLFGN